MDFPQQFNMVYSGQKAQAELGSEGEDEEEDGTNEQRTQALTEALAGQAETVGSHRDTTNEKSAAKLKRELKASKGWDALNKGMARLAFADGPETKTQYAVLHIRDLFDENHMQISMRAVCLDPSEPTMLCAVLRTFVWELYRKECSRQTLTEVERLEGLSSFMELCNKVKK